MLIIDSLQSKSQSRFREAFTFIGLLNKTEKNKIQTNELGRVMRSLGQYPTEAELKDIKYEVKSDEIEFPEFLEVMSWQMKVNSREEIRDAFKVYDKQGKGSISQADLRRIMKILAWNSQIKRLTRWFERPKLMEMVQSNMKVILN